MELREQFRRLHDQPFIIPNPWDVGSARLFEAAGFTALATTSSGHAATLGRLDGAVTREEAIEHAELLSKSTGLPVSADLENGFGDSPDDVVATIEAADATGMAGCSIEDFSPSSGLYDRGLAIERIVAAVEAARRNPTPLVLTARAENFIRNNPDLDDTITRLQAFVEAGADVVYAPGLADLGDLRRVVEAVDCPVNALIRPGGPTVAELFEVGVKRVSVGGAFNTAANAGALDAARELLDHGTHSFWAASAAHSETINAAFGDR